MKLAHEKRNGVAAVRPLPFVGDDAELALGLARLDQRARAACYDRFGAFVERRLIRTLGRDDEIADALQETFEIAFRDAHRITEPRKLRSWLGSIAVFVARGMLRKRRRRWLRFFDPAELPEQAIESDAAAGVEARAVVRVLDRMPDEERLALTLRKLEEMELTEVAEAMGISLATVKRRLRSAEERFAGLLAEEPALVERGRWREGP